MSGESEQIVPIRNLIYFGAFEKLRRKNKQTSDISEKAKTQISLCLLSASMG